MNNREGVSGCCPGS